jgi:hypothetical protein
MLLSALPLPRVSLTVLSSTSIHLEAPLVLQQVTANAAAPLIIELPKLLLQSTRSLQIFQLTSRILLIPNTAHSNAQNGSTPEHLMTPVDKIPAHPSKGSDQMVDAMHATPT